MTELQKQSLKHVKDLLQDVNGYQVIKAVRETLTQSKVPENVANHVVNVLDEALSKEVDKTVNARTWVQSILNDKS